MVRIYILFQQKKKKKLNLNENLGSESNTVHLYQREISRPLLSYKFDDQNNGTAKTAAAATTTTTTTTNTDRVKKEETGTEFVSAMCWSNVCIEIFFVQFFLLISFLA